MAISLITLYDRCDAVRFPHGATFLYVIHKLCDVYVNLYVCKRIYNTGENPSVEQGGNCHDIKIIFLCPFSPTSTKFLRNPKARIGGILHFDSPICTLITSLIYAERKRNESAFSVPI
ncbi:hypothetical protein SFRURICE_015461, partial [Spodoptera frugiperda]